MAEMGAVELLILHNECCKENINKSCIICPSYAICRTGMGDKTKEDIKAAVAAMTEYKAMRHPFGLCRECGADFNSELRNEYGIKYCPWCGAEIEV